MAQPTHYVPVISRPVVAALFHEAKRHRIGLVVMALVFVLSGRRGNEKE